MTGVAQLNAWVEQNKKPLAIAGAAAVAGIGLLKARKNKAGAQGSPSPLTPLPAGTAFTAGPNLVGSVPGVYSSAGTDVYNALQGQLDKMQDQLNGPPIPVPAPPKPIASTIFKPTGTGNYYHLGNGIGVEVESDGSLFGINQEQWAQIQANDPNAKVLGKLGGTPNWYSTEKNVLNVSAAAEAARNAAAGAAAAK